MKVPLIKYDVTLDGVHDARINGFQILDQRAVMMIDEIAIINQLEPDQIWPILVEMRKSTARLFHTYQKARVKKGEITDIEAAKLMEGIKIGTEGVAGTKLGNLLSQPKNLITGL